MERIKRDQRTVEDIMKIRTKLAIFVLAAVLSLAGFGVIANGLSADRILSASQPATTFYVNVVG